jgi:hypothetical protein
VGYLTHPTFGVCAHENHLFLACVAVPIVGRRPLWSWVALANLNLFAFYGLRGPPTGAARVFFGVDSTLLLSILEVALFCATVWELVRRDRKQLSAL